MTIGEALYDLLSTRPALATLTGGRITPVSFGRGEPFPAIAYNTRSVRKQACRGSRQDKEGILEIAMLANTALELQQLRDAVNDTLLDYDGRHGGYSIRIEDNDDDYDEDAPDIKGFFKRIQFDFTATT